MDSVLPRMRGWPAQVEVEVEGEGSTAMFVWVLCFGMVREDSSR